MGNQISQQLLIFGQSILLGLALGSLYDLLRPFRLRLPRLTALLDAAYCLAAGAAAFSFLMERGGGELRGFMVLGTVGGVVLFFCAFSQWLRPIWDFWADTLAFLVYLLSFPTLWLKNFCKKMGHRGKNLFYFAKKCYTIRKTGRMCVSRGGEDHGR
ncbi:spore cortex biosynthesis protein YabQ [Dysosmobacter sp.]|uniref:spore cortex biosynthesis protein YabQ n=1 Tax=Dysosmobacter sp. TaxID=2591382 RepID=UPI002A934D07|nr:spore cortex biosynthesis protein YabQ [Dysosmobacter sp.]MDY5611984.1 spore cortex biosynthesis protein YabQ [Dysosmobacter sp.]